MSHAASDSWVSQDVGSKPSRREQYAAMTRAAIVDAARKLFVQNGFDNTSVEDIARESQVSKGAVYHHFQDKRDVFVAVYQLVTAGVAEVVAKSLDNTEPGSWDRMQGAARAAIIFYAKDHDARALVKQVVGVLGPERTQALDAEFALPLISAFLNELDEAEALRPIDIPVAAHLSFRVLGEASLLVANAEDTELTLTKVQDIVLSMLEGLRQPLQA